MIKPLMVLLTVAFGLIGGVSAYAQAPVSNDATQAARDRLVAYLEATKTLTASFRSVQLDENRDAYAQLSGRVEIKRPGRFRWEYEQPEPELLVANGKTLWHYTPDLEQVVVREIGQLSAANPAQLLVGDVALDDEFDVVGASRLDNMDWVEIKPRKVESDFGSVRLGFVDGSLSMMEMGDKLDQITQFVFTDVVTNETLADTRFEFSPPPGTEVVD
ncbi:MAG: outer membrane lipoprotein chaperone LolA [Gammaproteobacteria bacterium]